MSFEKISKVETTKSVNAYWVADGFLVEEDEEDPDDAF